MAAPSSASFSHPAKSARAGPRHPPSSASSTISSIVSLPPQWLHQYEDFVAKNAGQVSQIESALRSLTYIIPGRFRDAEIASETLHSSVQLLSLYHDSLLSRAISRLSGSGAAAGPPPSPHGRYTRFWADRSPLYRRVALLLQTVRYTELLCEMAAKRRGGDRAQWRVVLLLEFIKACCRLLLLRITRSRPVVTPALPEREPVPEPTADAEADANEPKPWEEEEEEQDMEKANGSANVAANTSRSPPPRPHEKEWTMPRTGMSLPSLPNPSDITSYLLGRVLTADDIKPAAKLLNRLRGGAHAAEVLHILAPLVYALAMSRAKSRRSSWTPWVLGVAVECAARQLRDRGLRATALERDEWRRRGWAMGWWAMRGAFYESVTKGVVAGVRRRMPSLVSGILEDYEYLWENYYFSTSSA